ncbi:hypothetical protein ACQP1K_25455 [Sphaerimonospora sp. CA-214678]|uniref:hypothetical protein n=1 Tax=Sphaerimonospora sp. CA-214678 TaxID=3240029 RepID=UPI003D8A50C9
MIFQHVLGREQLRLIDPLAQQFETCNVIVTHSALGRMTLHEVGRNDPAVSEDVVAGIHLPEWLTGQIEEEAAAEQALEDHERAGVDALLARWRDEGVLMTKLNEVIDWVERVETVFVYIGRVLFSRSDSGSSTLIKGRLLPALRTRPLEEWTPEERLFVGAMQLLFRTGRAVRFEQFNGRQLSATRLRGVLLRLCSGYRLALGMRADADLATMTLEDLATTVRDLVSAVDESRYVRYRRVNGLTYAKDEFVLPWDVSDRALTEVPPVLAALAARHRGEPPGVDADPRELVGELTARAVEIAVLDGDVTALEEVLNAIVLGAVLATHGDYAMTSGIRDLADMAVAENTPQKILELRKNNFFCCVVPDPALARRMPGAELSEVLWQVAQRMMYNRWHFIPGNFDREQIPQQRHYFFPPLVPDIGEWCDQRHGGHTRSQVRFTLRAPGAAMWMPAFTPEGHAYRGCYDIRVVRMDGEPFTLADLRMASRYSGLIDVYWREVAKRSEAGGFPPPVIKSYGADWYREQRWSTSLAQLVRDMETPSCTRL